MTGRATFGDFASTASRHLDQLRRDVRRHTRSASAETADLWGVRRAVHTMAGYANDVCGMLDALPAVAKREVVQWIRAASQAHQALATADAVLRADPVGEEPVYGRPAPTGGSLRVAVMSMTVGRDLLHTHFSMGHGKALRERSEWAPVVASAPVACALLHRLGGWSRQLAPYVGDAAIGCHGITAQERHRLNIACQGLWVASWAVGSSQERQPVSPEHLRLLAALPVNVHPPAGSPAGGEPVSSLCDGMISTAERLRAAARRAAIQAAWSPALTRESLRQTAGCCAVTASSLQIVLRSLAAHHGRPCAPISASLAQAAAAADSARAAWLHVTEAWDDISTDTRGVMNQVSAEAARLALWTGRLAYSSPEWTPALGPRHEARPSGDLAASPGQLSHVVDAVNHVCHTLAKVAEADRSQARTASIMGRLVVPTRSLPDSFDVPYRFAIALGSRAQPLLSSYGLALQASEEATDAVAEIVAEVKAPGQLLGTYRAVLRTSRGAWAEGPVADEPTATAGTSARQHRTGAAPRERLPPPVPPGPVERILLDLDVYSLVDLKQAAAIDAAADQLILRAAATAAPSQPGRDLNRSAGTAELITHLLATSGDRAPEALFPSQPVDGRASAIAGPRSHHVTRTELLTSPASAVPAEPEAEAGA